MSNSQSYSEYFLLGVVVCAIVGMILLPYTTVRNRLAQSIKGYLQTVSQTIYKPLISLLSISTVYLLFKAYASYTDEASGSLHSKMWIIETVYLLATLSLLGWLLTRLTLLAKEALINHKRDLTAYQISTIGMGTVCVHVFVLFYFTSIFLNLLPTGSWTSPLQFFAQPSRLVAELLLLYTVYILIKSKLIASLSRSNLVNNILLKSIIPYLLLYIGFNRCVSFALTHIHSSELSPPILAETRSSFTKVWSIANVGLLWWMFYRTTCVGEAASTKYIIKQQDRAMIQVLAKVIRILATLVAIATFAQIYWGSVSGLATILGASTLGLGFAGQTIVANYLSGIMIYFENQFQVGDWIYAADHKFEGTVEYIGLRSTAIRTFDKRLIYVPNTFFASTPIVNASRMTNRRIKETIKIEVKAYTKLHQITSQIQKMFREHKGIDQEQTLLVHLTNFGEFSLDINVYAFTKTTNWEEYRSIQQDVLLKIGHIIIANGSNLAVPTRKLITNQIEDRPNTTSTISVSS